MTPGAWAAITAWGIPICWPRSWGAAKAPKTDAPATASLREGGPKTLGKGNTQEHSTRQHSQRSHSMTQCQPGLPLINSIDIFVIMVQILSSAPCYSVYNLISGWRYTRYTKTYFTIYGLLPYTSKYMTILFMLLLFVLPNSGSYLPVRPLNPFGRDSYLPGPLS